MITPNPKTKAATDVAINASSVLHPDYQYWSPIWAMIRDAEIGEVEVKNKAHKYLPKLAGHDNDQYTSYLSRAVFYNMTAKTLNALYGTLYKRNPKVSSMPKAMNPVVRRFSKDGMSLHLAGKTAAKEVISLGRYGMLVDAAPDGRGDPYVACYTAENIIDWEMAEIEGVWQYVRVVLREISYDRDESLTLSPYQFHSRFRILALVPTADGWGYEQYIYEDKDLNGVPDYSANPSRTAVPTVRGKRLDYIPFTMIGPFTNHPDVQKPPLLDIVTLNFSHYRSYAALEQGRFYTANPVYTVSSGVADDEAGEYYVGPDMVWELGKEGKASILEFNGHGLRSLETALTQKEGQVASIGGRMMPGGSTGAAESDNALRLKEQNEQTLLLNIADTLDEAFTTVLKWLADWKNVSKDRIDEIAFEVNRDFLLKDIGAREFRAIHQMYADGVIPVDVLYEFLRKAEVVPEWMDVTEFKNNLEDAKQFPNMVDVLARMKNFPDAKSFHEYRVMQEQAKEVEAQPSDPDKPPVPAQVRAARGAYK